MTCEFTFFSVVFQSYHVDRTLIMKGYVQWKAIAEAADKESRGIETAKEIF